jgi:hypothetical protein
MTSKIILGGLIALAFVAGTITTGTGVFAADHREAPLLGTAWHSILDKIDELRNEIQPEMTQLRADVDTNTLDIKNNATAIEGLILKAEDFETRIADLESPPTIP